MNIEIFDIESMGNFRYRVALRASGVVAAYSVSVKEEPIPGVSAPHSLWNLINGNKEATGKIVAAILEIHRSGFTALPIVLDLEGDVTELRFDSVRVSAAQSAGWYLSSESIEWASKHLVTQRSNTLFPVPFEHKVILKEVEEFSPKVQKINLRKHIMSGHRQMLAPKSKLGFRRATQLDPLDGIILTAIAYELGERLESARVPISEGIVFSFRFCPSADGEIWNPQPSYRDFQERTQEQISRSDTAVIVETDISAFYHSLDPHLVSVSLERLGTKRKHAEAVMVLLESLKIEGLPVGPSVSALFAEAVLTAIDLHLLSLGARFMRYNDDYKFFCKSEVEAQTMLQALADTLSQTAGLTMQDSKTRILSKKDYIKWLDEHDWQSRLFDAANIDYGEEMIDRKDVHQKLVEAKRSLLQQAVDKSHVAWVDICNNAFSSLPLEERRSLLPVVLDQLARVWKVAPQVSRSLEKLLPSSNGGRDLLDLVCRRLGSQFDQLNDYAITWLLHAFRREEWSGKETLAMLDTKLDPTLSAARRELLAALRGTAAAGSVKYDRKDPWQNRAHVWETRNSDGVVHLNDSPLRQEWAKTLNEVLATEELESAES